MCKNFKDKYKIKEGIKKSNVRWDMTVRNEAYT
jgi:hypothetical protein